jgi:hypothetical protein
VPHAQRGEGVTFQRRRLHFWLLTVCCVVVRIVCDDEEQPPAEAIQFDDGVYSTIQRSVQYLLILFICLLLWSSVNAMIGVVWSGSGERNGG